MAYTSALAAPKRFQWESNSDPSKAQNCGPTCVTQIASFYKDTFYYIETTRRLVTSCCTPTTAWQQRDMLARRGVPASVRGIDSLTELHGLVDSGRRPVLIGVEMWRVPSAYRDHPFLGWHALTIISGGYYNGTRGFWVTDPNFSPAGGIRPDPDRGQKWYPDWVMQSAYINNSPRYSVVPDSAKVVAATVAYVAFNAGVNGVRMRGAADARLNNIRYTAWATGIRAGTATNGAWIADVNARRPLYSTVRGADGEVYFRIGIDGNVTTYVQTRFMHRL